MIKLNTDLRPQFIGNPLCAIENVLFNSYKTSKYPEEARSLIETLRFNAWDYMETIEASLREEAYGKGTRRSPI
jgi:hypothetical protein